MTTTEKPTRIHRLHQIIESQCQRRASASALIWQDKSISYQQLQQRIDLTRSALLACTKPDERIAILALNCPEYIELLYAAPSVSRIVVLLNTRLSPGELAKQIQQVGASTLIGDASLITALYDSHDPALEKLKLTLALGTDYESWLSDHWQPATAIPATDTENASAVAADEPAWLAFTSGTTGAPKAATLTHRSLLAALQSANTGRPVQKNDCYLYPFPLFHVSAHNVLHQHLHGAAVALLPAFNAEAVLHCCDKHRVTTISLAPTMIGMLLDHPAFSADKLASVRSIGYGASAISETLLQRVFDQLDCELSQGFGMTELSGNAVFLNAQDHRRASSSHPKLLGSAGKPAAGITLAIIDDEGDAVATGRSGEIVVCGEQVTPGYWRQPEETAATIIDGWLHTGDIGYLDSDGYLYIVDRKKDIIVSGGENIASREVENVLNQYPGVRQTAVVGVPDKRWGEVVCAMIECATEAKPATADITLFCKKSLANYKAPKHIIFNDIPVNANGKVNKVSVRAICASAIH